MTHNLSDFLHHTLIDNQYNLPVTIEAQFLHYLDLLTRWNKVFNLTGVCDPEEMVLLHILDSLSIHPYLNGSRIADVGTGAGLPGIPLALLLPDKQFVLIDSNNKKTRFLTHVIHELKINNIEVVHTRCENFHPDILFDCVLSRAFASLRVMLAMTQHLVNQQGQFLAMKGVYPEQEIRELPQAFELRALHKVVMRGLNVERHLVCLAKRNPE